MAVAPLFALALMMTGAAGAADAPPGPETEERLPAGAPSDDYEFVAWCYGVLGGHMELFKEVKPELDAISKRWNSVKEDAKDYAEQQAAGRDALKLFSASITAAEKASPQPIHDRGLAAAAKGRGMWSPAQFADKKLAAYSWMNWGLPERCETVAKRLQVRSLLAAPALQANADPAPADAAKDAPTVEDAAPAAPDAPAPAESAAPAPAPAKKGKAAKKPASFVVDPNNPQPCPGRLEPGKNGAMLCKL